MIKEEESQMIKKAKAGDLYAFETLIISYEKMIYNIAYHSLQNEEDARDVAQEVCIKIYKSLHKFNQDSSLKTWIHRITVNACIDEIRKQKRQKAYSLDEPIETKESTIKKEVAGKGPSLEEKVIQRETVAEIYNALNQLKEEYRILIILRDIQGLSYEEIADITNNPLGTVKSRIARGRNKIKDYCFRSEQKGEKTV